MIETDGIIMIWLTGYGGIIYSLKGNVSGIELFIKIQKK
jgi:hypothetical protein